VKEDVSIAVEYVCILVRLGKIVAFSTKTKRHATESDYLSS